MFISGLLDFIIADRPAGGFNESGINGDAFIDGEALRGLKNWMDFRFYNSDKKFRSEEAKVQEISAKMSHKSVFDCIFPL
jgi:hypothetical protein